MKQTKNQRIYLPLVEGGEAIEGDEAKVLGGEYEALISKESITELEDERVVEILTLAIYHPDVDFWVSNANTRAAKTAGILTDAAKKDFQDQKALLREHIGNPKLPPIRGRAALPHVSQEELTHKVQEQVELERMHTVLEKANIIHPAISRQPHNQPDVSS